jgi:hypothetical protein
VKYIFPEYRKRRVQQGTILNWVQKGKQWRNRSKFQFRSLSLFEGVVPHSSADFPSWRTGSLMPVVMHQKEYAGLLLRTKALHQAEFFIYKSMKMFASMIRPHNTKKILQL